MTSRIRLGVFLVAATALACAFVMAFRGLAPLGSVQSQYGDVINSLTVSERHTTDAITAVNFDIRGFDTLGEEFILFASVLGVFVLMRRQKDEDSGHHEDSAPGRDVPPPSDVVRVTALLLLGPTVLFGLYMASHGQTTPGGGFQGGVILSSAPLLIYLCSKYDQFRRAVPKQLVEGSEALGAAAYIAIGCASVIGGGVLLENTFPLGKTGTITSGGTILWISLGVALAVSGGLTIAFLSYLEELVEEKEQ